MTWTTSYHHYDSQGSTVALTDQNANVTDTYKYTAFGETKSSTGTTENPFRYNGEVGYYFDNGSEDYYVRARAYEPSIVRWLSVDPIGFLGGDANFYRYVLSNPNNGTDPSGLKDWRLRDADGNFGLSSNCPTPVAKKCGVTKFVVTYVAKPKNLGGGTSLYSLQTDITFKKDAQHDPAKCEFRQFTWKSGEFKLMTGPKEWHSFHKVDKTWQDDGYTRADDLDGNKNLGSPPFMTTDGPGTAAIPIDPGWKISFAFATQQVVFDIDTEKAVAATPAIPITVKGQGRVGYNYGGIPKGNTVEGTAGIKPMGSYKK